MTTKDQAIAQSQFLTDVTTAAGLLENGKQSKALAQRIAEYAFAARAEHATLRFVTQAPDCRLCHYYAGLEGCFNCTGCTNGDKYQAAPAVVLWRTE